MQQGFQAAKLTNFFRFFVIFKSGVDWGISNPFSVSVPEVKSFRSQRPERGWKPFGLIPNAARPSFRSQRPERGWKRYVSTSSASK